MANPNDAVGTNGAFGGRTSVNAFNDVANFWSVGRVSGWGCSPSQGLTVSLGGDGISRDVALAQDASGNKTTINNISQAPVEVTVNAAPASNSRIDAIVAYVEDSPQGSGITDNPDVVNLLVVSGTVAANPVTPNDSAIRTAITADGASGSTAYYVVLASVTIPTGTTDIDATMITQGDWSQLPGDHILNGSITTDKIADNAVTADKIDFTTLSPLHGNIQYGDTPLNLTPGNWLLFGFTTTTTSGNNTPSLKLYKNNDVVVKETYCGNEGATVWENLVIATYITVQSGESWKWASDATGEPSTRSGYIAIKLG